MARRDSKRNEQPRSNPRSKSRPPHAGSGSRPPHGGSSARPQSKPGGSAHPRKSGPRPELALKSGRPADGGGPAQEKLERVQKVLAHAGLGSRRSCEDLIKQGRVSIDGQIVRELGTRVDPARAKIAVDGEAIRLESMVYYAINKPKGYVSTNLDPAGRPRVVDLLPEIPERVYTVGRLDEESTGLMILTNDGELANRLAHPRYGVEKLYRALIAGSPDREILAKLTAGIWLSDGKVRAKRARLVGRQGGANVLELVLAEGKNREIRRMLAKLGHKVMSLNRVAVGPISVKGLSSGECRSLSRHEVDLLWKVANGTAVSLPRHLDRDSPTRPPRDSNRPRKAEHGRTGRDQAGPARKRHRDATPELGPPRSSNQGRPPMPSRPASTSPLPAPPPARRRIIGLEVEPPTSPGPHANRERGRKRPPPRKQRPSPQAPLKRPIVPVRPPGADGEDA
jgi:23S rRNA pseudouridine2605 synthase